MSDDPLALANTLLDHGQPVVVCKPRPGTDDTIPIVAWRGLTDSPEDVARCREMLDRFERGRDALLLLCGFGLDVIDVDTKVGGSAAPFGDFASYGTTATPSGGWHHLVPGTGLRSVQGLEVVGQHVGDYLAAGRGAFLPGSVRPKYADVAYGVKEAWDVAGCLAAEPEPHVAAMVREHGGEGAEPEPYVDDSPERDPALGVHPSARRWIDEELARLDDLPRPWEPGSYWDDTTFKVACKLLRWANSNWTGYSADDALADLLAHAPADEAWGERENLKKWEAAKQTVGTGGRPVPNDPRGDFDVIPGPAPAPAAGGGQTAPLAVRLRERVEADYDVFPAGNDGRVFVRARAGGRAELLTSGLVIRAGRGAGSQMSSLSAAATEAAKVLAALAEVRAPRALSLRAHQAPGRLVLDLAQPGNSRCAVVTPGAWEVRDVPPADVTFQSAGRPLPDPERGGDVEELRALLRWAEDDPRWPLVKGWLPCSLLADVPRPLLGFFGPQGSAKSTTGRFVVDLVDPKPSGALGSGFGKNRADDETKAFASYLVAWDNVSKLSDEGADLLSRLVTGDMIERRRLYTDADLATVVYRRTGVLTGISVPRGVKADTLDRLVLVALEPLAERVSERALEAEWARARPRVLAGVLDLAAAMLAGQGANPDGLRMADYAEALWAIDPALYRAYAANVGEAREEMATNDPFVATLRAWLAGLPGREWEGTATDARRAAEWHRVQELTWWPGNGKAFMDAATANAELLRAVGVTVTERRSNGRKVKRFALSGPLAAEDQALL